MSLLQKCEIHAEYKIQHKEKATVTNFVKASREFETTEEAAVDELDDGIRFLDMDSSGDGGR